MKGYDSIIRNKLIVFYMKYSIIKNLRKCKSWATNVSNILFLMWRKKCILAFHILLGDTISYLSCNILLVLRYTSQWQLLDVARGKRWKGNINFFSFLEEVARVAFEVDPVGVPCAYLSFVMCCNCEIFISI